jgi:hypothetical protein
VGEQRPPIVLDGAIPALANRDPVVVLSHDLWRRRFDSDPSVAGRAIRLNGLPLTIIGVTPGGVGGARGRERSDLCSDRHRVAVAGRERPTRFARVPLSRDCRPPRARRHAGAGTQPAIPRYRSGAARREIWPAGTQAHIELRRRSRSVACAGHVGASPAGRSTDLSTSKSSLRGRPLRTSRSSEGGAINLREERSIHAPSMRRIAACFPSARVTSW